MKIKTSTSRGFTIVELMIVLLIAGVVIGMAAPNFSRTIKRNQVQETIRGFETALNTAKHTARTSGRSISICPVTDITLVTPICSNWEKFSNNEKSEKLGWVVFRDSNRNNQIDINAGDANKNNEIIKKIPFTKGAVRALWSRKTSNIIGVYPQGGAYSNGTLCVFIPQGDKTLTECKSGTDIDSSLFGYRVTLSPLGRIHKKKFYK